MKKYLIYTILFGILFSACNPNKEIYQNIDDNRKPFKTDFEITLTEDDYSLISDFGVDVSTSEEDTILAEAIDTYKSFSALRPASIYVGAFLDEEYIAPDSASNVLVTFDYEINEYDSLSEFTLTEADYIAIGGVVADSLAFTYNELPESFLSAYLLSLDATENYVNYVTFEYWENDSTKVENSIAYELVEGEWVLPENTHILTIEDYQSMGNPGPGAYNNFSSSTLPHDYLPAFLRNEYRTAIEGDELYVFYKWYGDGEASIKLDIYNFNGNAWTNKIQMTDQFVRNSTQWLFDPTVKYNMVNDDYDILVQYIANHEDPNMVAYWDDYYGNSEYYYGASAHYGNFDMRLYKRRDNDPSGLLEGLTDEEAKSNLTDRLKEGLKIYCELRFPTANAVSNGVQVYYEIYYATYEPGDYFYKMKFKVTDTGKFEYESGPELLD